MSSNIKPKMTQQIERQFSQYASGRKKELSSHRVNELKKLGESIQQNQIDKQAVNEVTPVINHIQKNDPSVKNIEENKRLYNRQSKWEENL